MYKYNLVEGENHPLFIFTTQYGDIINVGFIPTDYKVIKGVEAIYSVDVSSVSNNNGKIINDVCIGQTVSQIICNFMNDNPNILLNYVCESIDRKEYLRYRKFNHWNKTYSSEYHETLYYEFQSDETTYYTSFIFNSTELDTEYITSVCNDEMSDLTNKN